MKNEYEEIRKNIWITATEQKIKNISIPGYTAM